MTDGRTTRWGPTMERLVPQLEDDGECIVWTGLLMKGGYGGIRHESRSQAVHRVVYQETVGPIPDGLTIDHLCKNRRCVNPDHLEIVSRGENSNRGDGPTGINFRKTHCVNGHPFSDGNTYSWRGHRFCRECCRANSRRHYWKRKL